MNKSLFVAVSSGIFLYALCGASAEVRQPNLKNGMATREVVKLWGEPVERIEEEVKRRNIWLYPQGARVVFHESRVVQWSSAVHVPAVAEQAQPARVPALGAEGVAVNPDTRDLVREIARELPSGPDVPFVESSEPPVNVPVVPNPGQPMQNSLYGNPAVAGNQPYVTTDDE